MSISSEPAPERLPVTLNVGQDASGHWLVQESLGRLEGRFISFAAAMTFARSEHLMFPGSSIVVAQAPLVPIVSFAPVQPWEMAVPHAANADAPCDRKAA